MTPTLRPATADDLAAIARLAADGQRDPARFQAYFGDDVDEIAGELADTGDWASNTVVAVDDDGSIVGWISAERDDEIGRVWWWGPVVATDHDWSSCAESLFDAALGRVGSEIDQFEFAVGDRHAPALELALARGYRRDTASVILVLHDDVSIGPARPHDEPARIRVVDESTADAVAALHDRVFPGGHLNGRQVAADRDALVLAAVDDADAVVGYLRAEVQPGGDGYIDFVGVDDEARGRGIGAALVTASIAALRRRGVGAIRLTVREDNTPARALYERLGFDGSQLLVPLRLGFHV